MSVPLCHSSFGARWKRLMKSTNFPKQLQMKRFLSSPEIGGKKDKSTSAYTDIAVILYVCLTLTDFLCFRLICFWKHMLLYWFSCVVCNIFPTLQYLIRGDLQYAAELSWSIATFVGHLLVTANTLQMTYPSPNLSQRGCCVPFLSKPLHKPLFAMCLCYVAYTDQAKHYDHKES